MFVSAWQKEIRQQGRKRVGIMCKGKNESGTENANNGTKLSKN